MRIGTALYNFLDAKIKAAAETSALADVELKEDVYGDAKAVKTLRIGDVQSEPLIMADDSIKEANAFLTLQCLVKPEKATPEARIEAANIAHEMAIEIAKQIGLNETLNSTVCDCTVSKKLDGFANIATTRYAVSFLLISFNSYGESEG